MPTKIATPVTMRVKIGDAELEVSGPQKFVEEKVAEFISAQGSKHETTSIRGAVAESIQSDASKKPPSLAQLLKKANLKSDVDRALIAGYYLETFKEYQSFTAAEIKDAIRDARISPPSNPSDVIAKNIRKGVMMQAGDKDGRMAYVLTTDGAEFVEEQLKT